MLAVPVVGDHRDELPRSKVELRQLLHMKLEMKALCRIGETQLAVKSRGIELSLQRVRLFSSVNEILRTSIVIDATMRNSGSVAIAQVDSSIALVIGLASEVIAGAVSHQDLLARVGQRLPLDFRIWG